MAEWHSPPAILHTFNFQIASNGICLANYNIQVNELQSSKVFVNWVVISIYMPSHVEDALTFHYRLQYYCKTLLSES